MRSPCLDPVVHLQLQTGNRGRASAFYTRLFGWQAETVEVAHCTYLSLKLGDWIEGGIAEHNDAGSLWLPVSDAPRPSSPSSFKDASSRKSEITPGPGIGTSSPATPAAPNRQPRTPTSTRR